MIGRQPCDGDAMTTADHESSSQDLSFDQAEFDELPAGPPRCTVCETELFGTYFEINSLATCERCRFQVEEEFHTGSASGRFFRALVAGVAAGAVGAGVWFAVQELTGYHVGLIAIVVGWLVGKAVRWGCNARGGWVYQGMAMTLTYVAISAAFVPGIIGEIRRIAQEEAPAVVESVPQPLEEAPEGAAAGPSEADEPEAAPETEATVEGTAAPVVEESPFEGIPKPVAVVLALCVVAALALAAPLLSGIISIIIVGIGVYEAWRQNRKLELTIEGPFQLSVRPPGGVPEPLEETPTP
jgi:hypothetical protein